ncbi:ROK family protein [Candidatus Desantisbacteria bacterium]|nr:ROK family protein [Candidatus Desantisbacteria bacterium]
MNKKKFAIGIDFGGTNIRGGLVDNTGKIKNYIKISTGSQKNYQEIKNKIIFILNKVISKNSSFKKNIAGVGIGFPGLIDVQRGIIIKSPNLPDLRNAPLALDIAKKIELPVVVENDANTIAWGEYCCGKYKNPESMICITIGTGIGGGIIINNNIWRGFSNTAGEIGHMIIKENGIKCGCGSRGCLEQYASASAMIRDAEKAIKRGVKTSLNLNKLTAFDIYKAAKKNDILAKKIFLSSVHYLSLGIASLINSFNPEIIVIAGGVAKAGSFYISPLKKEVYMYAYTSLINKTKIVKSTLGDCAGIIGSAFLILNADLNL